MPQQSNTKPRILLLVLLLPLVEVAVSIASRLFFPPGRYAFVESISFIISFSNAPEAFSFALLIIAIVYVLILFKLRRYLNKRELIIVVLLIVSIPLLAFTERYIQIKQWQKTLEYRADVQELILESFSIENVSVQKTAVIGVSILSYSLALNHSEQLENVPSYEIQAGKLSHILTIYPKIEISILKNPNGEGNVQAGKDRINYSFTVYDDEIENHTITINPEKVLLHPAELPVFRVANYL